MNSLFDWSLVRSFLAVLEKGSLLAASRHLQLSQPTIGRHVAELESHLGLVLFELNESAFFLVMLMESRYVVMQMNWP